MEIIIIGIIIGASAWVLIFGYIGQQKIRKAAEERFRKIREGLYSQKEFTSYPEPSLPEPGQLTLEKQAAIAIVQKINNINPDIITAIKEKNESNEYVLNLIKTAVGRETKY
jgi:hypothetical protein